MTWEPPDLTVEVALEQGPWVDLSDLAPEDWTELSARVEAFTMDRGRQDQLQTFDPGTVSITLANDDRQLDPLNFYGLTYRNLDLGLPGCPVRVKCDSTTIFTGYLGPEGWPVIRDRGTGSWATLNAYDKLALAGTAALPSSPWAAVVYLNNPLWWVRGNSLLSANADGGTFFDEAGDADPVVSAGTDLYVSQASSLIPNDDDPSMFFNADAALVVDEADLLDTAPDSLLVVCAFKTDGNLALNDPGYLVRCESSDPCWEVKLYNGQVVATFYDSGGSVVDSLTATANPDDDDGRWDDGEPHMLALQWALFSSYRAITVDSTSIDTSVSGDVLGPGAVQIGGGASLYVDEVAIWRDLTTGEQNAIVAFLAQAFTGLGLPFNGDDFDTRIGRLLLMAGWEPTTDDILNFHTGDGEDETYWGAESIPSTLLDALQSAVADRDGAVWMTREGHLRARTAKALTNTDHDEAYAVLQLNFTNDPDQIDTPDLDLYPYPRGPIEHTGTRLDRVVNIATVTLPWGFPDAINPSGVIAVTARDEDSIARYGPRKWSTDTGLRDPADAMATAGNRVGRFAVPPVELKGVPIFPWGWDGSPTIVDLELEQAVLVTDIPSEQDSDGDPIGETWVAPMNVQGIHWQWSEGSDWTVTLDLARNGAADPE